MRHGIHEQLIQFLVRFHVWHDVECQSRHEETFTYNHHTRLQSRLDNLFDVFFTISLVQQNVSNLFEWFITFQQQLFTDEFAELSTTWFTGMNMWNAFSSELSTNQLSNSTFTGTFITFENNKWSNELNILRHWVQPLG
ncbi:hypothetical protein D3C72_2035560 [compost metagenome]